MMENMIHNPAVSVIVPVYNVEKYLCQCVDSILSQSFTDFELILIDDGSPDNCGILCDKYAEKDSRIRVIHQENGGLSAARNAGMRIMKGKYIAFIDSDDYISTHYLSELYNTAVQHNAEVVICGKYEFVDGNSFDMPQRANDSYTVSGRDALKLRYRGEILISCWAKLISVKLLQDISFPAGKIHEDQEVMSKVLLNSNSVSVLKTQMYFYRIRANSITGEKFSIRHYDNIELMDSFINHLKATGDKELLLMARNHRKNTLAEYALFSKINNLKGINPRYRMSHIKALWILRKKYSNDRFTWYLSQIHPHWVKPYGYLRKVEKMLRKE